MLQAYAQSLYEQHPYMLVFMLAFLPLIVWILFWRNEDLTDPEPISLSIATVTSGCIAVFLAIPLEKIALSYITDPLHQIVVNSSIEETLKLYVVYFIAYHSRFFNESFDYIYYGVLGCLGFAFMENILFLLNHEIFSKFDSVITISQMRFLGATLLHVLAGASIGIILALVHKSSFFVRVFGLIVALFVAIGLHSAFNYFIINSKDMGITSTLSSLWICALIIISLAERIRFIDFYETKK